MAIVFEIRPGAYYDSVVLMQLQKTLTDLPGVADAGVVMGTLANHDLLAASGLYPAGVKSAKPDDLLIIIKGEQADFALSQVDALLQKRRSTASQAFQPRSLASAFKLMPQAGWVMVSVPGRYAADVTRDCLKAGKHVMLYSDNVSLEEEISLKQEAASQGLLVMGPDCGTAIIGGIGLGFANRVKRGEIGLVGASGTGLQAITSHIHNAGGGISHAIGTGGRDLKAEVGAITAQQGLDVLARDANTAVIVLVSKPPAPDVAVKLLQQAQGLGKPVVVYFIGYAVPGRRLGNVWFATSLHEAAQLAIGDWPLAVGEQTNNQPPVASGYLRGLFSGGTLAYEALLGLQNGLFPIFSNVPIRPGQKLDDPLTSQAHTIVDMGEDVFTQGRLHPMMDNDLRIRRLRQEAEDAETGLILLDVVLGEGAHGDPAGELAPVISEIKAKRDLEVVAVVVGTDEDGQDRPGQIEQLQAAGATVFTTVPQAVEHSLARLNTGLTTPYPPVALDAFDNPMAVINVGLASFYESVVAQGAEGVQVAWRPPAGGNEKLMALLARMKK